jgi:hypothetical protein
MTMRLDLRATTVLALVATGLVSGTPSLHAIEDRAFRIVASAEKATCADVVPASLARLPLGTVLVAQDDVEGFEPAERAIVLSRAASARLVTNAGEPQGPLADAGGRAFVVMTGGTREVGGLIVSRIQDVGDEGGCAVLLAGPVVGGRLHVVIGIPRSSDVLHESFWKVLLEDGAEHAFAPALPERVSAALISLFPSK